MDRTDDSDHDPVVLAVLEGVGDNDTDDDRLADADREEDIEVVRDDMLGLVVVDREQLGDKDGVRDDDRDGVCETVADVEKEDDQVLVMDEAVWLAVSDIDTLLE